MSMEQERPLTLDPRTQLAVTELETLISKHYPAAVFELARGIDDPSSINITAVVDIDDPDDVLDKVVDRVIELNVEDGIPVHVVPVRTPERIALDRQQPKGRTRFHSIARGGSITRPPLDI